MSNISRTDNEIMNALPFMGLPFAELPLIDEGLEEGPEETEETEESYYIIMRWYGCIW